MPREHLSSAKRVLVVALWPLPRRDRLRLDGVDGFAGDRPKIDKPAPERNPVRERSGPRILGPILRRSCYFYWISGQLRMTLRVLEIVMRCRTHRHIDLHLRRYRRA